MQNMLKPLRLLKLANGEYRPGIDPSIPEIEIKYVEEAISSQCTKPKEVPLIANKPILLD
jgi:hypothetical protein